ncbi:MAG: hypothetical protein ACLP00_14630 [Terracidiphilus sp.]
MKTSELETRAERALAETLGRMSGVDVMEMRPEGGRRGRPCGILVRINVLGHSHTLACAVERDGDPVHIQAVLRDSWNGAPNLTENSTPIIIAPYLSREAQTACQEADAGFLDLEGNAHLSIGELFIAEHSFPSHVVARAAATSPGNCKARSVPRPRAKQRIRNVSNNLGEKDTEILEGKRSPELLTSKGETQSLDAQAGKELGHRGVL